MPSGIAADPPQERRTQRVIRLRPRVLAALALQLALSFPLLSLRSQDTACRQINDQNL